MMNAMDMLPVDLLPVLWQGVQGDSHAYLRVVPTADLSTTLGLSSAVLILCFFYSIKIKGMGGWAHELVTAPFGTSKNPVFALILGVINLAMQIIEYVAKTVSFGIRLSGNRYAGELVFCLIALMGGAAAMRAIRQNTNSPAYMLVFCLIALMAAAPPIRAIRQNTNSPAYM